MTQQEGQGIAALITVLARELASRPDGMAQAMVLVADGAGRGDNIGLLFAGEPVPGGLDLLESAIQARAHPQATVALEWTRGGGAKPERRYQGWLVQREEGTVHWRRLGGTELRTRPDPRIGQALGANPRALFEE